MENWELNNYQKDVRSCLETLRIRCLGLNTSISAILPKEAADYSDARKAELIAGQILFQVALLDSYGAEELEQTWHWAYTIARYLFEMCNPGDQTFYSFERLLTQGQGTRMFLFEKSWAHPDVRESKNAPIPLQKLDAVFLGLLDRCGLLQDGMDFAKQLESLL